MAGAVIRANRTEVSERFPMLGFTVRSGTEPFFETVVTTDPGLLESSQRARRTLSSFWSSRGLGPLPAERGEAIFILPDEVLRRFAGQTRLFYAVATFSDKSRSHPQVSRIVAGATPFVTLSPGFATRRTRQIVGGRGDGVRWNGSSGGGYTGDGKAALEWAGDAAQPGTEGAATPKPAVVDPNATPGAGTEQAAAPAASAALEAYDDGYDKKLWVEPPAGNQVVAGQGSTFDLSWPDVPFIPAGSGVSARAASAAMVAAWRDQPTLTGDLLDPNQPFWSGHRDALSLESIDELAVAWDLEAEAATTPVTIDWLRRVLELCGPLWVSEAATPRAYVITGIYGDGTPQATYLTIHDPVHRRQPPEVGSSAPAAPYVLTVAQALDGAGPLRVVHAKAASVSGRRPNRRAQSYAYRYETRRGDDRGRSLARQQAAPVAVPIVSAIVGATMTRILNNDGDVKWELDQLQGLKHPGDDPARSGPANFTTTVTKVADWPVVENGLTDQIYADFEIEWQYNGHSVGNVTIKNTHTNDAWLWGLEVKGTINNDATVYAGDVAALRVTFQYRFTRVAGADGIAIRDLTLRADGQVVDNQRWTQRPSGWSSEEQSLAKAQNAAIAGAVIKEIASPIVETVLKLITDSLGDDLTWTVPKLEGMKHVNDDKANRGTAATETKKTDLDLPRGEIGFGITDEIYIDFRITWQYDGRSLGNVFIQRRRSSDAIGWALDVKTELLNDAATYTTKDGGDSFAAIKLLFTSTFTGPLDMTKIALTEVTLYGNGTVSINSEWTQD